MRFDEKSTSKNNNGAELAAQLAGLNFFASIVTSEDIKAIRAEFPDQFLLHQLRLRPSVGSFSLVSCNVCTPQIGFPGLKTARQLRTKLETVTKDPGAIRRPGRKTPEKRLQSWLLQKARSSEGSINGALVREGSQQWLVSDEIALSDRSIDGQQYKVVADILLIEEDANGCARLVSVELKSSRVTETFRQVQEFREFLDRPDLERLWQQFAETMTGRRFNWVRPFRSRGVVVWPAAALASIPERTRSIISQYRDLDVIGYSNDGDGGYHFEVESSV